MSKKYNYKIRISFKGHLPNKYYEHTFWIQTTNPDMDEIRAEVEKQHPTHISWEVAGGFLEPALEETK